MNPGDRTSDVEPNPHPRRPGFGRANVLDRECHIALFNVTTDPDDPQPLGMLHVEAGEAQIETGEADAVAVTE